MMMAMAEDRPVFVDWIKFDGVASIDSGFTPPSLFSICMRLGHEEAKTQYIFATIGEPRSYIGATLGGATTSAKRQVVIFYESSSYLVAEDSLSFTYKIYDFFLTPKRYGWGTYSKTYTKGNLATSSNLLFGTFNPQGTASHYTGRFYTVRVFDSTTQNVTQYSQFNGYTPVATFRPCLYRGRYGMWHVEENRFCNYYNEGNITGGND